MNHPASPILVGQFDSPFVRRVAATLHLYGVPFTRDRTSGFSDAMARVNPLMRIPTLILPDGERLFDSHAILDHLDEGAAPEVLLMPRAGAERRRVLQATVLATGSVEKAGAVVYERHYHAGIKRAAEWESRCARQLAGGLAHLESQCAAEWYCGPRMTQADVTVSCLIGYLRLRLPEAFDAARYPSLDRIAARCESLDAFRATVPGEDERMPANGSAGAYRPRPIRCLGDFSTGRWRLKTYGISAVGQRPRAALVKAALDRTAEVLPAESETHHGFVLVHDAAGVCFANYYWWENANELHQRSFVSPPDAPADLRPVTHPAAGCVWELEVIDFERRAWMADVLQRVEPDYEAYFSRRCNTDV